VRSGGQRPDCVGRNDATRAIEGETQAAARPGGGVGREPTES
jgi:hypothetical protein